MGKTGSNRHCPHGHPRFKLVTADLKLAAQQDRFPAHFRHTEEGSRQLENLASRGVTGDEVEEVPVDSEQRTVRINKQLSEQMKEDLKALFLEYKDVFAWDHTELKGIDPRVCQHRIPLKMDARPVRMQRYRMNPNYAAKVKEEINALLKAGFIAEVESSDWLFPIVVVSKKNGKLRICVDFRNSVHEQNHR